MTTGDRTLEAPVQDAVGGARAVSPPEPVLDVPAHDEQESGADRKHPEQEHEQIRVVHPGHVEREVVSRLRGLALVAAGIHIPNLDAH